MLNTLTLFGCSFIRYLYNHTLLTHIHTLTYSHTAHTHIHTNILQHTTTTYIITPHTLTYTQTYYSILHTLTHCTHTHTTACTTQSYTYTFTHKGQFVLFNDSSRAHGFSYHWLLDVKHMVMVAYFFRRNPLSPHNLLFLVSSKGSILCTFPLTGQHIPQPLMDQL